MPNVNFTPSNPNTTTRENFTNNILNVQIPSDAAQDWADAVRHQQGLYKALYEHEAMAPNRQQTFMTSANQKSAVYHCWDFVGTDNPIPIHGRLQATEKSKTGPGTRGI
ncbi:hypothetical protein PMZ80_002210 [Knufia obscura]|uniref:Uncharacterized protein n=2 Tax=Knufia TaxID=430999 RepID=A0AAN8I343_9EURO|nr:hypothetical protein PMZ80_002210 [Knufia obscura]KAK5947886.1 hypothetical protein OHC33_011093 [Knufia fluminis]